MMEKRAFGSSVHVWRERESISGVGISQFVGWPVIEGRIWGGGLDRIKQKGGGGVFSKKFPRAFASQVYVGVHLDT